MYTSDIKKMFLHHVSSIKAQVSEDGIRIIDEIPIHIITVNDGWIYKFKEGDSVFVPERKKMNIFKSILFSIAIFSFGFLCGYLAFHPKVTNESTPAIGMDDLNLIKGDSAEITIMVYRDKKYYTDTKFYVIK